MPESFVKLILIIAAPIAGAIGLELVPVLIQIGPQLLLFSNGQNADDFKHAAEEKLRNKTGLKSGPGPLYKAAWAVEITLGKRNDWMCLLIKQWMA